MSNQTDKTQKAGSNQQAPAPFVKKEKVPSKIGAAERADVSYIGNEGPLKDSFAIVLSGTNVTRQVTIHHPIGYTDLDSTDWVLSEPQLVEDYLGRQKFPGLPKLEESRKLYRTQLAVEAGLLGLDKDGNHVYAGTAIIRDLLVRAAREAAEKSIAAKEKKWKTLFDAGEKVGPKPVAPDYITFLTPELMELEGKTRDFLKKKSTIKLVETKYPLRYRTMGGPRQNIAQERINPVKVILTRNEAIDQVMIKLHSITLSAPADGGVTIEEAQEIPDKLDNVLEEYQKLLVQKQADDEEEDPPEPVGTEGEE